MNRIFKFRCWDSVKKEWDITKLSYVVNNIETITADGAPDEDGNERVIKKTLSTVVFKETDSVTVQFTGLFDCDGVEIWEGDIIEYYAFGRYLIHFDEGAFRTDCLEVLGLESFMFNTSLLIDAVNGDGVNPHAKVIGNRFEHPELLEMKE